jgi:hypothetical protein
MKLLLLVVLAFANNVTFAGDLSPGSGNAVTRWNAVAAVLPVGQDWSSTHACSQSCTRPFTAVNGVKRRYQPYTADLNSPGASVDAAIAAASRDVLVALSPSQKTPVEFAYAAALLGVPDGPAKTAGIALGQEAAAQAWRAGLGMVPTRRLVLRRANWQGGRLRFPPPFDGHLWSGGAVPRLGPSRRSASS